MPPLVGFFSLTFLDKQWQAGGDGLLNFDGQRGATAGIPLDGMRLAKFKKVSIANAERLCGSRLDPDGNGARIAADSVSRRLPFLSWYLAFRNPTHARTNQERAVCRGKARAIHMTLRLADRARYGAHRADN
jgi:hypothetical protein